jgi:hypothetical protein
MPSMNVFTGPSFGSGRNALLRAPAATHRPMLLAPFDDARLISLLQLLSFRPRAHTPVGSYA